MDELQLYTYIAVFGSFALYFALAWWARAGSTCDFYVASGGISSVQDVIEFILAGAHLVQIGTRNYTNPNAGVEIANQLSDYCKRNNFKNLNDLKGKMIPND